jgi:predicted AlkP superfamily pyrophosphatase or phosphodiesterase
MSRADDSVMALAGVAIDELDLGQRNEQDFLALSLSASDRVGHGYGPFGQETFSTLLNVDRLLGEFFELLDEEVGEGRWVVGTSGDHGVATMPEYARELGNPDAERILASEVRAGLSQVLNKVARGGGTLDEMAKRLARGVEERGLATRA